MRGWTSLATLTSSAVQIIARFIFICIFSSKRQLLHQGHISCVATDLKIYMKRTQKSLKIRTTICGSHNVLCWRSSQRHGDRLNKYTQISRLELRIDEIFSQCGPLFYDIILIRYKQNKNEFTKQKFRLILKSYGKQSSLLCQQNLTMYQSIKMETN